MNFVILNFVFRPFAQVSVGGQSLLLYITSYNSFYSVNVFLYYYPINMATYDTLIQKNALTCVRGWENDFNHLF